MRLRWIIPSGSKNTKRGEYSPAVGRVRERTIRVGRGEKRKTWICFVLAQGCKSPKKEEYGLTGRITKDGEGGLKKKDEGI